MPSDDLLAIVYSSRARTSFDEAGLTALLAQARANNDEQGLSGMLLYRAGRFIQVLEGPELTVREIVARIAADPRHTDMRILLEERLDEREFADWTMGFEPIRETREAVPNGFRSTFDDLEGESDASATRRALRELTLWFRVRSASARTAADAVTR